jgi:hypothetical protein
MKDIRIDVGVTTVLKLTVPRGSLISGQKLYFTIKNPPFARSKPMVEKSWEFAELFSDDGADAAVVYIYITPEESMSLKDNAEYDFNKEYLVGDEIIREPYRTKYGSNGKVNLRRGVGGGIV